MKILPLSLDGAWVCDIQPLRDSRGMFARTYCSSFFQEHEKHVEFVQQSISWNPSKGTLRGMHFQRAPMEEGKLIRVTRGAIYDVIVDIRVSSPTFGMWLGLELSSESRRQLFVPKGFAHGFQTLEEYTEVFYQMTTPYCAACSDGIRWNDEDLDIKWPVEFDPGDQRKLSEKDASLQSWNEYVASL